MKSRKSSRKSSKEVKSLIQKHVKTDGQKSIFDNIQMSTEEKPPVSGSRSARSNYESRNSQLAKKDSKDHFIE